MAIATKLPMFQLVGRSCDFIIVLGTFMKPIV